MSVLSRRLCTPLYYHDRRVSDALHRHRIFDTMTMSTHLTQKSAPEIDALFVNMYYSYSITFVVVPATLTI